MVKRAASDMHGRASRNRGLSNFPVYRATLLFLLLLALYIDEMDEKKLSKGFFIAILRILGVIFGLLVIISGELDDSPGLQGIGMILILFVFFSIFKIIKRN